MTVAFHMEDDSYLFHCAITKKSTMNAALHKSQKEVLSINQPISGATLTMSRQYNHKVPIELAKRNAIPDMALEAYARALHTHPEVVADLKCAHEADSEKYSEEEFNNLAKLVTDLMNKVGKEHSTDRDGSLYGWPAFGDFNRWYLEEVIYGNQSFDDALSNYIEQSPYVKSEARK
ncbi:MAG: hypothetical protein IOC76_00140 [Rhodobacter sp.]|nr:hypothetical protein [Rhodobacter sp.]